MNFKEYKVKMVEDANSAAAYGGMKGNTTVDYNHYHKFDVDGGGDGETNTVQGHKHQILGYNIMPSEKINHVHDLIKPSSVPQK
jgi:hypothetical protein